MFEHNLPYRVQQIGYKRDVLTPLGCRTAKMENGVNGRKSAAVVRC